MTDLVRNLAGSRAGVAGSELSYRTNLQQGTAPAVPFHFNRKMFRLDRPHGPAILTITPNNTYPFHPGPVLLLGAPGVGKGTQAKVLMSEFKIPQISTGDLLRQHRREHTALGLLADELMKQGKLVPDDLVNQMVAVRLASPDCQNGYILDGFPRTLAQAEWLDGQVLISQPVVVVSISVPHEELLQRITGRRVCPSGHIYNIYTHAPVKSGICDHDGQPLTQRNDDTVQAFDQRMREYDQLTAPVLPHYRAQGRFSEVDGRESISDVTAAIRYELETLRGSRVGQ